MSLIKCPECGDDLVNNKAVCALRLQNFLLQ